MKTISNQQKEIPLNGNQESPCHSPTLGLETGRVSHGGSVGRLPAAVLHRDYGLLRTTVRPPVMFQMKIENSPHVDLPIAQARTMPLDIPSIFSALVAPLRQWAMRLSKQKSFL